MSKSPWAASLLTSNFPFDFKAPLRYRLPNMQQIHASRALWAMLIAFLLCASLPAAELFHVATYNLENYFAHPSDTRPAKAPAAKAQLRESLRALHPEVLALQELGGPEALHELQADLKAGGLNYPYSELVGGRDTNIFLGVLSQFPIIARTPHTNDSFLLFGRRFWVSRGFLEVDLQVNTNYSFTLLAAHLKSRLPSPLADEADWREQEALVLRQIVSQRLQSHPDLNLIVLGDFNDTKSSKTIRSLLGRGRLGLIDTRPAERNGDDGLKVKAGAAPRNITWTYYYDKEDTYSRIDYILLSHGMAREWQGNETYILAVPNWGLASDHRPLVAGFLAEDGK